MPGNTHPELPQELEGLVEAQPEAQVDPELQAELEARAEELATKAIELEQEDNLAAAVEGAIGNPVRNPESPAKTTQMMTRVSPDLKADVDRAAEELGITSSEFVRETLQKAVDELLRCTHPPQFRQVYPWSESCLKCGTRLRADDPNPHAPGT